MMSAQAVPGLAAKWALLFRDYLRAHPAAAAEYEAKKRTLAVHFRDDRHGYTQAKGPQLWVIIRRLPPRPRPRRRACDCR
jgi:GrpB-like predicted nucleotidyltransferase (UPF0157 family)